MHILDLCCYFAVQALTLLTEHLACKNLATVSKSLLLGRPEVTWSNLRNLASSKVEVVVSTTSGTVVVAAFS